MTIIDIIKKDKGYPAKAAKYDKPLISYYSHSLPAWILRRFVQQATIEEIATFYFGYFGDRTAGFLGFLEYHNVKTPDVHGIKTIEFWDKWQRNNLLVIMDMATTFGK